MLGTREYAGSIEGRILINTQERPGEAAVDGIEETIRRYIGLQSKGREISACMLCGSYVYGGYGPGSDLDILFLVEGHRFEMILERFEGLLFDRMVVDPGIILKVLGQKTFLSDVLSLSFGSARRILKGSADVAEIVKTSERNVTERQLVYVKNPRKPEKAVDGVPYLLSEAGGGLFLTKDGVRAS